MDARTPVGVLASGIEIFAVVLLTVRFVLAPPAEGDGDDDGGVPLPAGVASLDERRRLARCK